MTFLLPLLLLQQQDAPALLLKRVEQALRSARPEQMRALFARPEDAAYLERVAKAPGEIRKMTVNVFPAPKGWESTGQWWVIMSSFREVEAEHDYVFPVVQSRFGWRLGAEIPEWKAGGRIESAGIDARIRADKGEVEVSAGLEYEDATPGKAMLFRLNHVYELEEVRADEGKSLKILRAAEGDVVEPAPGDAVIQVGGLVAVTPPDSDGTVQFRYRGKLGEGEEGVEERDVILPDRAYITAYWVPSLGRLPFTTQTTIQGPKDWVIRSEGEQFPVDFSPPGVQSVGFKCDVPISFPKIIGGRYVLAAEGEANGKKVRSFQFEPIDKRRAQVDVGWMEKALEFYEENLGEFPFDSYECFDGKGYYGIESYSHTLLAPEITSWAVSHEMGHTYFGGLVPCAYVRDTWNEGLTQYVDDVLLHDNAEEVGKRAFSSIDAGLPLSKMDIAWADNGATYFRGAFVMQMLDAEIGHEAVMEALRDIIEDRQGKDTVWEDLRPYFQRTSRTGLRWFWRQWIDNGQFPTVSVESATTRPEGEKWISTVRLRQSGTPRPFRLRFVLSVGGKATPVLMTRATQTYTVSTDARPDFASVDPSTTAFIKASKLFKIK